MTVAFLEGNAFDGKGDAVVVTVNCVGAMGRGIALECKLRMPWLYTAYRSSCHRGKIHPGRITLPWCLFDGGRVERDSGHKAVVLLPTKDRWQNPSKATWVINGILELRLLAEKQGWESVDMTLPGCSNGWIRNKGEIRDACVEVLGPSKVDFKVWFLD